MWRPLLTRSCVNPQILVWRFWTSYNSHLRLGPDHEFVDPVRATPLESLAIVAVGVIFQCIASGGRVYYEFNEQSGADAEQFSRVMGVPFIAVYLTVTCYFMRAGARVLRSLPDTRARMMSAYLLASSFFMVLHLAAVICFAAEVHTQREISFGLVFFFVYMSRAGTAMCCISIFHEHADSAFLYMEVENARLAEDVERLEADRKRNLETAALSDKLRAEENARVDAERQVEKAERKAEKAEMSKLEVEKKRDKDRARDKDVLLQKERDFGAKAMHELNNPVNGIVGTTDYILDELKDELTARVESELRGIKQCTNHMQVSTDIPTHARPPLLTLVYGQLFMVNVLSNDKILAGTMALPSVLFFPAKLCSEVMNMTRHSPKTGVNYKADFPEAEVALLGAPTQLNLMLLNLVSNATKFTTEGSIVLGATVLEESEKEVTIKFAMTDSGPGIPEDKQQGIFDLRSQTGGLESQSKGFGIGLNITSRLAVLMGGQLEVRSPLQDDRGSEFSFTLVLKKAEKVVEKDVAKVKLFTTPIRFRVLVVDDIEMNQKLMGRRLVAGELKELEWTVDFSFTGEEALKMLEGGSVYDLIVMDENMQDAGGKLLGSDTTRLIREREAAGGARVIIVGHSGNSADEDKKKLKECGQDWFWGKPPPSGGEMVQDVARLWGKRAMEGKKEGEEEDTKISMSF